MPGLPSVMQAKKAELQATLAPLEQVKPTPKKPVPVMVVQKKEEEKKDDKPLDEAQFAVTEEVPVQVEKKDEEVAEVKPPVQVEKQDPEENTWKWKFESLRGNHEKIVEENRGLRDRLVVLEAKFDGIVKQPVQPPKEEPSLELTKEEQDEYGPALPVLAKLLTRQRREIENSVVKPLQEKIISLEKNTDDSTKKFQESEEANFLQQVQLHVKDFNTIVESPEWKEFAKKPLSDYTDETIGVALMGAHAKRDLKKVVKIFTDFTKVKPTTVADAFRAPTVSNASGDLPDGKKPKLAWSKREEASLKFRKRQIEPAEFNKIVELYRRAQEEGRIDYDK